MQSDIDLARAAYADAYKHAVYMLSQSEIKGDDVAFSAWTKQKDMIVKAGKSVTKLSVGKKTPDQ